MRAAAKRSAPNWRNGSRNTLRTQLNEAFGQTECNLMLGNNNAASFRPGRLDRFFRFLGHEVEIVDDAGAIVPAGTTATSP